MRRRRRYVLVSYALFFILIGVRAPPIDKVKFDLPFSQKNVAFQQSDSTSSGKDDSLRIRLPFSDFALPKPGTFPRAPGQLVYVNPSKLPKDLAKERKRQRCMRIFAERKRRDDTDMARKYGGGDAFSAAAGRQALDPSEATGVINLPFSQFSAPFTSVKVGERNELPEYLRQKIEILNRREELERLRSPSPTGNLPPKPEPRETLSEYTKRGNLDRLTYKKGLQGSVELPLPNKLPLPYSVFDAPYALFDLPLSKLSLPFSRFNTPLEPGHAYTARAGEAVKRIGLETLVDDGLPSPLDQPQNTHGKYIPASRRTTSDDSEANKPSFRRTPGGVTHGVATPMNAQQADVHGDQDDVDALLDQIALGGKPFNELPDFIQEACEPNDLVCQAAVTLQGPNAINLNSLSLPYSFLNTPMSFFNLPLTYVNLPYASFNLPVGHLNLPYGFTNLPFYEMIQTFGMLSTLGRSGENLNGTTEVPLKSPILGPDGQPMTKRELYYGESGSDSPLDDAELDCSEFEPARPEIVSIKDWIDKETLQRLDVGDGKNRTADELIKEWIDIISNTPKRFEQSAQNGNLTRIKQPRDAMAFANDLIERYAVNAQAKVQPEGLSTLRRQKEDAEEFSEVLRAAFPSVPDYGGLFGTPFSLTTTPFSLFNLPFGFFDQPLAFTNLPFSHFNLPLSHMTMPFAGLALPTYDIVESELDYLNDPHDSIVELADIPPSLLELLNPQDPLTSYVNSPLSEMNLPFAVVDLPFTVFDMPFAFLNTPYSHLNLPYTHLHLPFEISSLPFAEFANPFGSFIH